MIGRYYAFQAQRCKKRLQNFILIFILLKLEKIRKENEMYLSTSTADIIHRTSNIQDGKLMSSYEWWLICFLGTEEQPNYVHMYILYLKGCIKEKMDEKIFKC